MILRIGSRLDPRCQILDTRRCDKCGIPTLLSGKGTGFTFIELLFVIIIISVLSAISLPQVKSAFVTFQLNSSARELQEVMNFLNQRAITEQKIIYLAVDTEKKEYYARIKDESIILKTHHIPDDIHVESEQKIIGFYPDGSIDKITIKLSNQQGQNISLTTEGIFGGIKAKFQ